MQNSFYASIVYGKQQQSTAFRFLAIQLNLISQPNKI